MQQFPGLDVIDDVQIHAGAVEDGNRSVFVHLGMRMGRERTWSASLFECTGDLPKP